jgi:monoamine oxidase
VFLQLFVPNFDAIMGFKVIIIGAGAAGLQAGRRLSSAGAGVTILEAGARPGGRIVTIPSGGSTAAAGYELTGKGFSETVEGGAEFIHGDLPLSLQLAREAGVALVPTGGQMIRLRRGESLKKHSEGGEPFPSKDWHRLMEEMRALTADMPMAQFLNEKFPGPGYEALRDSARSFAQGYDLADLDKVSTLSLYREWSAEDEEEESYRAEGGYGRLIGFLTDVCRDQGCRIHFSTPVTGVRWQRGKVEVHTAGGEVFTADRLVVTVSLGALKAGLIRFDPALPVQAQAIDRLGYGQIVKALLEWKEPFWRVNKHRGQTLFIISEEPVPTWWTQSADDCALITGWITGEPMRAFRRLDEAARIDSCVASLAAIFGMEPPRLRESLKAAMVFDWVAAPYFLGGYSFETVGSADARSILSRPVEETIYFSGEALYEGNVPGTVEAAFNSGLTTAETMISTHIDL